MLITTQLAEHHPLSNVQWGFSAGKGTVTALLATTHQWFEMLEDGHEICAIFFDFRKAFDSVPHRPLLQKLQTLGLDTNIILWVENYLTLRHQNVVVNGSSSDAEAVLSGVPQGSVLGPLLFLIYVNDLASLPVSPGSQLTLYADDLLLFRPISDPSDYSTIQRDMSQIENWSLENSLDFNTSKCKYMVISRKRNPTIPAFPLLLNDTPVERVECFKYLGLLLSSDLSWTMHTDSVCKKAKKILGLLYRRYYSYVDGDALRQMYISLVRPHLEYGCVIWDPHTISGTKSLESVQYFACKMATKCWDSSYEHLLELMDLPTLEQRRVHLKLGLMYKIIYNLCYFPPGIFSFKNYSHYTTRNSSAMHPLSLEQHFAHTNAFYYSFVPHSISLWN
jgi:hypothetical protein